MDESPGTETGHRAMTQTLGWTDPSGSAGSCSSLFTDWTNGIRYEQKRLFRIVKTGHLQADTPSRRYSLLQFVAHQSQLALLSSQREARSLGWGSPGACVNRELGATMAADNKRELSEVEFLTVAEVAQKMRVSKMTVYRLVHGGELPAVRVGRSFRVSEDDVNEYLSKSFFQAG